jgi:hypothetical protein
LKRRATLNKIVIKQISKYTFVNHKPDLSSLLPEIQPLGKPVEKKYFVWMEKRVIEKKLNL